MNMLEELEFNVNLIKDTIKENNKAIHRREVILNDTSYVDIASVKKQLSKYRTENELLNIRLCRYNHLIEYIKMHSRVTVAYAVFGKDGHRQRASWDESTKIFKENVPIEFLNADITGHHGYSIVIITASNSEECEQELYNQLSDGAFESCSYGKISKLGEYKDFTRDIEIMATIGLDVL